MKDRNGKELKVGDRVYVPPRGDIGGVGYVRRITSDPTQSRTEHARVDDGPADMSCELDDAPMNLWHWSAWVQTDEVEAIP